MEKNGRERFSELVEFYPHSYTLRVKRAFSDIPLVVTNPKQRVHHVFVTEHFDPLRAELSAALVHLGEIHHLLSTDYFSENTQREFYELMEPFTRVVNAVRYGWAGRVASKYSPDPNRLLSETLKRIEIEYLNHLYRGNRNAAIEVLPLIAFAKGLSADWDFFNHRGLNRLLDESVNTVPDLDNLLLLAERFSKYLPCFCSFDVVKDPRRGFEVFELYP